MKKSHPQPETQNPEALYAKVNKPRKRGGPRILSPEEIQSRDAREPNRRPQPSSGRILYAEFGESGNNAQEPLQEASAHNRPRGRTEGYDTPPQQPTERIYVPQNPSLETAYAPQRPLGNPYDRPSETPSNGHRAKKLANPYEVVNLLTGEPEFQHRENPLYDSPNGSTQDVRQPQSSEQHLYAELDFGPNAGRSPHKPLESVYTKLGMGTQGERNPQSPEHTYAELDFDANSGRSPQKPVESVYAKLGMGAEGGQESQQRTNPIYEGVGRATTPPPRTPKDVVTTRLLQHTEFQHGVTEVQVWCKTVYGNEHALNQQLAKILENPQDADRILWDLAEYPEGPRKLAGSKILGIKSPDRKAAEDGFSPLCTALERHIHKTQKLHKQFTREQERGQEQERAEGTPENRRRHHHHRHHHARGQNQDSPEHSPQRQRHEENKGMAYAM